MGGFIARQPNGLFCRFSTVVDCPTHCNLTREEYLNNATGNISSREEGEDILENHLQPFSEVIERFEPENMSQEEFDHVLIEMNKEW